MQAKRAKPYVPPRLEVLEARLALVAKLTPLADNADHFTLQIDLSQHPRGGDGLPDTVFVSRAGGAVEVVLVGRTPEVLFRGDAGSIAGVELLGSADVDYVLVGDRFGPPLTFHPSPEDVLVQIGEPIPGPAPVEEPEIPDSPLEDDPVIEPGDEPSVPPDGGSLLPVIAESSDLLFDGGFFLSVSTSEPLVFEAVNTVFEEEDRPLVPPEMLGGAPEDEPLDVRRLTGGSHEDAPPADLPEIETPAEAEQEPADDDEIPPDEPVE